MQLPNHKLYIYTFGVSGASPGYNSVVVVIAGSASAARKMSLQVVADDNQARQTKGLSKLQLNLSYSRRPFLGDGVVYYYNGEA